MTRLQTILHPTDLSEDSQNALGIACSLARDHSARLVVLSVYPPPLNGAEAVDRERPDGIEEDLLVQLRGLAIDPAVEVDYQVEEGRPI